LCFPILSIAQEAKGTVKNDGPIISVSDTISLGEIFVNDLTDEHGRIQVKVSNKGNRPLILKNVSGCCGTNIKSWPKAPILPGKDAQIYVEFRTEPRPQKISRTITVESNANNNKMVKVAITGVVIEKRGSNEISL
ncbi:MAG TPA: DUF1573 domain-containing protein, partial [Tenuifilaceae bacterium]|nr:DUF1573 domain-containing protein [Tenuifilaceae bacterium]